MTLTSQERITNILQHKPVDRIGLFEHFWSDTQKVWTEQGHIQPGESLADHFGFDMELCWPFNMVADPDFALEVIEETAETYLAKDGNGAILRRHKLHDATPEHVDFTVKDRAGWEEHIKPKLKAERRRINVEAYHDAKERARQAGRFFAWSGLSMGFIAGYWTMGASMALSARVSSGACLPK